MTKQIARTLAMAMVLAPIAIAQTTGGTETQVTAPAPRKVLQAKTQEEHTAFLAAMNDPDPAAGEAAARLFAEQYPDSDLKGILFGMLQRKYQAAGNEEKVMDMGRMALQFDPDNTIVLVVTSTQIAERTRDTDLDRDERYAEAVQMAQHAIDSVETGLVLGPQVTPEQVESVKKDLLARAHAVLGMVSMTQKNYASAEGHFRTATELNQEQPDPYIWYRLALCMDYQKKYAEALVAANRAVELAPAGDPINTLAKQEQNRLTKLVAASAPKPAAETTPKSQP